MCDFGLAPGANGTRGWWEKATDAERAATGVDPKDPVWGMIALAMSSRARPKIIPMQDVLNVGSEARMNTPGRVSGNWTWRMDEGTLTTSLAERLRVAVEIGRRVTRCRRRRFRRRAAR